MTILNFSLIVLGLLKKFFFFLNHASSHQEYTQKTTTAGLIECFYSKEAALSYLIDDFMDDKTFLKANYVGKSYFATLARSVIYRF